MAPIKLTNRGTIHFGFANDIFRSIGITFELSPQEGEQVQRLASEEMPGSDLVKLIVFLRMIGINLEEYTYDDSGRGKANGNGRKPAKQRAI